MSNTFNSVKAVLFDLDGTITDTEKIYKETWVKLAPKYNIKPHPAFPSAICGSSLENAKKIVKHYYPNVDPVKYRDDVMTSVAKIMETYVPLKPGAEETISYLYEKGLPLIIASSNNKKQIIQNLEKVNLYHYFADVVAGNEITNGKPEPEIFITAAEKAGFSPKECLVIEDAKNGVLAGSRAGCKVIMVPDIGEPSKEIEGLCDHVYPSLFDVKHLAEKAFEPK